MWVFSIGFVASQQYRCLCCTLPTGSTRHDLELTFQYLLNEFNSDDDTLRVVERFESEHRPET